MKIRILNDSPPFEPTHWYRFVSWEDPFLVIDTAIDVPYGEPVGLAKSIDKQNKSSIIDPDAFVPLHYIQTVQIHWRGKNYFAALDKVKLQLEAFHDLRSVHGLDAQKEMDQLIQHQVDEVLNGN